MKFLILSLISIELVWASSASHVASVAFASLYIPLIFAFLACLVPGLLFTILKKPIVPIIFGILLLVTGVICASISAAIYEDEFSELNDYSALVILFLMEAMEIICGIVMIILGIVFTVQAANRPISKQLAVPTPSQENLIIPPPPQPQIMYVQHQQPVLAPMMLSPSIIFASKSPSNQTIMVNHSSQPPQYRH